MSRRAHRPITKTYVLWQADNGVYHTSLKEVITAQIAVLAHKLNNLCCSNRVATRDLPSSGHGDVRDCARRTPLCGKISQQGLNRGHRSNKHKRTMCTVPEAPRSVGKSQEHWPPEHGTDQSFTAKARWTERTKTR